MESMSTSRSSTCVWHRTRDVAATKSANSLTMDFLALLALLAFLEGTPHGKDAKGAKDALFASIGAVAFLGWLITAAAPTSSTRCPRLCAVWT